ncbi:MAG: toprim domain-containing protein, partial [Ktedonobacteraceae bacterium]|nr:toprim domain-containing protein [Ktedonobacteraceae bacterium]
WFCPPLQQLGRWIIVVEGGFDRLALLAAGVADEHIVSLAGTTLQPDWLPAQVQAIILALDADATGRAAMTRLVSALETLGLLVITCPPEEDGLGKDWSERWRRAGIDGVAPLFQLSTSVQERLRHLAA